MHIPIYCMKYNKFCDRKLISTKLHAYTYFFAARISLAESRRGSLAHIYIIFIEFPQYSFYYVN